MRRHVVRIAVCLVVGLVVNVLVAWGLALWTPMRTNSGHAKAISQWPAPAPSGWPAPVTQKRYGGAGWTWRIATVNAGGAMYAIARADYGWPWRTLSYAQGTTNGGAGGTTITTVRLADHWTGWELLDSSWQRRLSASERVVPLRPMWAGIFANSVAFGALAWLVIFGAGWIRRRTRAKRGHCVSCGYALAGLVRCPECGK